MGIGVITDSHIILSDIFGKTIEEIRLDKNTEENIVIQTETLSLGLYFISLISDNQRIESIKLMKME